MPSEKTGNKIASISTNRKGQQVVVFSSGEKIVLSQDAFTEMPLYVGKEVKPLEMRELRSFLSREKFLDYGMRLVSSREYSTKEIRNKLQAKGADPAMVKEVLFYLKKNGFIDDKTFAEDYADSKGSLLYGKERILSTLQFEKGIAPEILSSLKFKDEKEHAKAFLAALMRRTAGLPAKSKRIKLSLALSRRGFAKDTIAEVLLDLPVDKKAVKNNLEKEATKAIKHYGSKYNGYELKQKCFAYLYSKGFPSSEIDEILEEKI